jgi:hypothetical protein
MMKIFVTLCSLVAAATSASAFVPQSQPQTQVVRTHSVAREALADRVFGMDLFNKEGNKYGARAKKDLKVKPLGSDSYIPNGLTKAEYEKIRAAEFAKKQANYQKKASVAFKFEDFTQFYKSRGTQEGGSWLKAPARGHKMVKTKYDWDGVTADAKKFESTKVEKFKLF